jgi:hypothetical protein
MEHRAAYNRPDVPSGRPSSTRRRPSRRTPLAALCLWLSYHTEQVAAQRIRILQRQLRPSRRR